MRIRATPTAGVLILLAASLVAATAHATIVRFNTVSGNIDVRLYNTATPLSVANFLTYLNSGSYTDSFFHRSIPGFIIQGGGYYVPAGTSSVNQIAANPPVMNEYGISNLSGTLAYAKVGPPDGELPNQQSINSATSEWFFNLGNNDSTSSFSDLNSQNGGFTVFGRVVGNGMSVVNTIAGLGIINVGDGTPFDNLPVVDFEDVIARNQVLLSDLVYLNTVTVLNYPKGDYDFNGKVDAADYTVWKDSFGSKTAAEADGNGDGVVNAADYTIWRDSFGQMSGPGSGASLTVPEPGTMFLVLSAAVAFLVALFASRRRIWAHCRDSIDASPA